MFREPWTGWNGTRAHETTFKDVKQRRKEIITNRSFNRTFGSGSNDRPDFINIKSKNIWELKPSTHDNPASRMKDKKQLQRYLNQKPGYTPGNSRDLFPTPENLPWDDKYNLYVYPGPDGFLYWELRKKKSKERSRDGNPNFSTNTNGNCLPPIITPIGISSPIIGF